MTTPHSPDSRPWLRLAALLGTAACTANPPADARPKTDSAPAPAAAPVAPPAPDAPPAPVARVEPPAPAPAPPSLPPPPSGEPAPAEPVGDAPPVDPAAVPPVDPAAAPPGEITTPAALIAAPIVAAEHQVVWRDVVTLPAAPALKGFQYLATGVLAGADADFSTLDAAGAWVAAGIGAPPGHLVGHWPDEVWAVEHGQTRDRAQLPRLRLHRLRGTSRWVPQAIGIDQWVDADRLGPVRKSWNVGFLAIIDNGLVRVASNGVPDPDLPMVRGSLRDLVESKAGALYTLAEDNGYYVQIACADAACVQANAIPLPPGAWEWEHTIPRQKHSVSMTLHDPATDVTNHILHYETGGWKLEALPAGARFAGLWPTTDGGLWAQTADALLHRDPAGVWRSVALPADFSATGPVFAAMPKSMSELVIMGVRGGAPVLLATAAKAQIPG
ncbi:hypothetical protein [Nannocystis sp. SCPEA4]|uniref:hypothetical protein n=1 Tax=Nannocystis sp. SCPEA4 TaxID=2996787 RepID=UPI002270C08D|nr:hypothetical protein [Nannocystis sp. SCPEA4]MCY1058203.1 hypothetical protein [Nannocystis sp. SCPEA4]